MRRRAVTPRVYCVDKEDDGGNMCHTMTITLFVQGITVYACSLDTLLRSES